MLVNGHSGGSIVGRADAVRGLTDVMATSRLVTLIGPGGVGKSTLATEVIDEVEPEFEQVVFDTPVGEVTPIFETPHGFNVIKVLDRREGTARSFEEVRAGLMMVLARESRDEQLRQRVDALRAAADIRILDPQLQ